MMAFVWTLVWMLVWPSDWLVAWAPADAASDCAATVMLPPTASAATATRITPATRITRGDFISFSFLFRIDMECAAIGDGARPIGTLSIRACGRYPLAAGALGSGKGNQVLHMETIIIQFRF